MLGTSSTQEQSQGRLENGLAAGGISESTLAGVPPQHLVAQDNLGDAQSLLIIDCSANLKRNNVQWLDANGDGVLDARAPAFAAARGVAANDFDWRRQA